VQRYGHEITGGSEALARAIATRLAARYDVTVLTTCATDYVTWRNELAPGTSKEEGVEVRRFPVEQERDMTSFNALSEKLYSAGTTEQDEREWLRQQGPYCPSLIDALARHDDFDATLFFTYLYYPTVEGLTVAPEHSILVSTAHDEPPLKFGIYAQMFSRPRALAFLTGPEADLVRSRFDMGERPNIVAGVGIERPPAEDIEAFRIERDLSGPYALYAGRIDAGKGCDEMVAHYRQYRMDVRGAAQLVLIGKLAMPEPRVPGVRYLGYLSEQEKGAALSGASAIVCPSAYESLSIVLLEGYARGVPALASARSPVLLDHCRRSNGGLAYANRAEFVESLDLLVKSSSVRTALGEAGRRYVEREYSWPAVIERYESLIQAVS